MSLIVDGLGHADDSPTTSETAILCFSTFFDDSVASREFTEWMVLLEPQ